jgi:hypothetical protein
MADEEPESTRSYDEDTDMPGGTREATEEPSIFDQSSPEKRRETPDSSMERLSSTKENVPGSAAATRASSDNPDSDEEENDQIPMRERTTMISEDESESDTGRYPYRVRPGYIRDIVEKASRSDADRGYLATQQLNFQRKRISSERKKDDQGAKLIDSLIDCLIDYVEERITRLENGDEDAETKPDEKEKKPGPGAPEPGSEWEDILLEMKFYRTDGEFGQDHEFLVNNTQKKGSYACTTDPIYFMRVLYNWTEGVPQKPSQVRVGESPDPNDIDIIAFGITSKPVASFFEKRLGLQTEFNRLVRIGKPFRPLIRLLKPLEGQLEKLEKQFGSVPCPKYPDLMRR